MTRLTLILRLALFAPALTLPLTAGGQDAAPAPAPDFESALDAVARGDILPLADILPRIEREFAGRAIDTEIETDDGRWVYELEILTADGRLFEVDVDAATGETLEVEEEVD
jgi:uncharacterized membrane protein YkoI